MDFLATTQLLGNLGEFIGSIAILVTLGYLAVQVRQSRELLERNEKIALSQVYQARSNTRREAMNHISDSTYLAELLGKVDFPEVQRIDLSELSPGDRVRLKAHCGTIYFHQENNLYQYELGLLDERTYELTGSTILQFMPIWRQMNVTGTGTIEDWYTNNHEGSPGL